MEELAINGGKPVRTEPFAHWPIYGALEEQLLTEVVRSGHWGGTGAADDPNRKVLAMEQAVAKLQDAVYGISVVNGTVAITAALLAAGVKPGDEVIMPPYTFIATASAALAFGAIPVFVDIEEDTLLLDPEKIEAAITGKTKAIIAVHIAGAPANMTRILAIARTHNLVVIEDAAQAVGAQWEGKGVGSHGDFGTFSFQSSKNLNCGEGGMITTNRQELRDGAWSVCNVGRIPGGAWYQHETIGQNYRMTELQAAILLAQMTRLEEQMQRRERSANLLDELLAGIDGIRLLKRDPRITRHAYHLYMFKLADSKSASEKEEIIRRLQAEGIPAFGGYVPLHRNEAILGSIKLWTGEIASYECPVCDRMCEREVLWLTQNMLLSDDQAIHDIATAIRKVMQR